MKGTKSDRVQYFREVKGRELGEVISDSEKYDDFLLTR